MNCNLSRPSSLLACINSLVGILISLRMNLPPSLTDWKHTHGFPFFPIPGIGGGRSPLNSFPTQWRPLPFPAGHFSQPSRKCAPPNSSPTVSNSSELSNPNPSVHLERLSELIDEKLSL
ncbi:glycosyl hydrolase family protein [Striga asiatica]|uniref:Glycosyl hydrolase family protein n=1 Tax=Striga asiatica TaxID=4170 RepID=A0A5A7PUK3_STRAF|nr:glycosyl hydrolase family protein [Striga asiatica]